MENKDIMIKAIYEKIADKTLSFGCRCKNDIIYLGRHNLFPNSIWRINEGIVGADNYSHTKIIGHPVMIGDYLDWQEENYEIIEKLNESDLTVIGLWKEKRKPIEEQSQQCIDYIYNLIK